jgi:asparaginyl-tRNA synthetase
MMEPEVAFCDNDQNMQLQEDLVCYIVGWVLQKSPTELETLKRDVSSLEAVQAPFPRMTYDEAIERLQKAGLPIQWGSDFGAPDEEKLMEEFERPLFVFNWPRQCKAFYMKRHPDRPDIVLCSDLLGPEGYGELIGGSQREDNHDFLLQRVSSAPSDGYAVSTMSARQSRSRERLDGCIRRDW